MRRRRSIAAAILRRITQPSSFAGLAGLALLAGQTVDNAQAWGQAVALVCGLLAVAVDEGQGGSDGQ